MSFYRACARRRGRRRHARSRSSRRTVEVAIVRRRRRRVFAIDDECSHAAIPLSEGDVGGLRDRVLAARLALRPAHRQADRPAGHRAGRRSTRCKIDGDDVLVDVEPPDCHPTLRQPTPRSEHGHAGDPRPARHGRHRGRPEGDPQGRRPDHQRRRDARDHGPERLRQVDAGLLDRRPPEVHRHRRLGHPRRRGRARDEVDERARAGLFLAMQYPVEVPGVSVSNFLRTAKTAIDGEAPKLRTWVKDVNAAMDAVKMDPAFAQRSRQRGLLRRREEAPRDRPARAARTRRSRSSTRPTPASTSTRCKVVSEGVNRVHASRATAACC